MLVSHGLVGLMLFYEVVVAKNVSCCCFSLVASARQSSGSPRCYPRIAQRRSGR